MLTLAFRVHQLMDYKTLSVDFDEICYLRFILTTHHRTLLGEIGTRTMIDNGDLSCRVHQMVGDFRVYFGFELD
jgi:hypothetical protein